MRPGGRTVLAPWLLLTGFAVPRESARFGESARLTNQVSHGPISRRFRSVPAGSRPLARALSKGDRVAYYSTSAVVGECERTPEAAGREEMRGLAALRPGSQDGVRTLECDCLAAASIDVPFVGGCVTKGESCPIEVASRSSWQCPLRHEEERSCAGHRERGGELVQDREGIAGTDDVISRRWLPKQRWRGRGRGHGRCGLGARAPYRFPRSCSGGLRHWMAGPGNGTHMVLLWRW